MTDIVNEIICWWPGIIRNQDSYNYAYNLPSFPLHIDSLVLLGGRASTATKTRLTTWNSTGTNWSQGTQSYIGIFFLFRAYWGTGSMKCQVIGDHKYMMHRYIREQLQLLVWHHCEPSVLANWYHMLKHNIEGHLDGRAGKQQGVNSFWLGVACKRRRTRVEFLKWRTYASQTPH